MIEMIEILSVSADAIIIAGGIMFWRLDRRVLTLEINSKKDRNYG